MIKGVRLRKLSSLLVFVLALVLLGAILSCGVSCAVSAIKDSFPTMAEIEQQQRREAQEKANKLRETAAAATLNGNVLSVTVWYRGYNVSGGGFYYVEPRDVPAIMNLVCEQNNIRLTTPPTLLGDGEVSVYTALFVRE